MVGRMHRSVSMVGVMCLSGAMMAPWGSHDASMVYSDHHGVAIMLPWRLHGGSDAPWLPHGAPWSHHGG